jgi:hypothetical protein
VVENLTIEVVAENDQVLAIPGRRLLIRVPGIPDPSFAHEIEPGPVHDGGALAL